MPMAFDKGNQNTEKPYAMPMQRWIANAAGGTSHRLKPEPATVRSFAKNGMSNISLPYTVGRDLPRV
jgi:hypothetical protein